MSRGLALIVLPPLIGAAPVSAQAVRGDYSFDYTIPPQARAIPALKAWLDRDAAAERAAMAKDAAADHRDARKSGQPVHPYEGDRTWKVVTDTPRFLSLSLEAWEYTGGAHGNSAFGALLWDKVAGRRLDPRTLFAGKAALNAAVRTAFCRQLDAERRKKRGNDAPTGTGIDEFDRCIPAADNAVILGSSDRRAFDRIGFLIAPYAAGPYAEGAYEVTLPVTPAIIAAVKPEWRRYFALGR